MEKILSIKEFVKDEYLWASIDETTDTMGRCIANAVIGVLSDDPEKSKEKFLLNSANLEKTNNETVAQFFKDLLQLLGDEFNNEKVLLLVTDAAPYMKKAATNIRNFCPNMNYVTCVAHGLHRV